MWGCFRDEVFGKYWGGERDSKEPGKVSQDRNTSGLLTVALKDPIPCPHFPALTSSCSPCIPLLRPHWLLLAPRRPSPVPWSFVSAIPSDFAVPHFPPEITIRSLQSSPCCSNTGSRTVWPSYSDLFSDFCLLYFPHCAECTL